MGESRGNGTGRGAVRTPRCGLRGRKSEFTVTIFSDVHHGDYNYNDFACTDGLKKLEKILIETPESEFYVNLGDMADYLKDGKTDFYDEVAAVLRGHNLNLYHPEEKNYAAGGRTIYNLMGNHEAAFIRKAELSDYIPYVEGVGSVYSFRHGGILFLAIDANFDRETGSDEPSVLRTSTKIHPSRSGAELGGRGDRRQNGRRRKGNRLAEPHRF